MQAQPVQGRKPSIRRPPKRGSTDAGELEQIVRHQTRDRASSSSPGRAERRACPIQYTKNVHWRPKSEGFWPASSQQKKNPKKLRTIFVGQARSAKNCALEARTFGPGRKASLNIKYEKNFPIKIFLGGRSGGLGPFGGAPEPGRSARHTCHEQTRKNAKSKIKSASEASDSHPGA